MKVMHKIILGVILFAGLAVAWWMRYDSLNSYYSSFSGNKREIHQLEEIVSFDDNYINDLCVSGYSIRVDNFTIQQFEDYINAKAIDEDMLLSKPDKIALVYITLFNENSAAEGIMLTAFGLHGVDNYVGLNWDLLLLENPVLQGNFGIGLSPNTEYKLVLPFDLYQEHFGDDTWRNIENYQFFLHTTAYPVEKDIQVQ